MPSLTWTYLISQPNLNRFWFTKGHNQALFLPRRHFEAVRVICLMHGWYGHGWYGLVWAFKLTTYDTKIDLT